MIKREKFDALLGKTIAGVVVKVSSDRKSPGSQVYLEFTDGTVAELYSNDAIIAAKLAPWDREVAGRHLRARPGELYVTPER